MVSSLLGSVMSHSSPVRIRQVVNIVAADPDFTIIMQWTGRHPGGHHSFEDFHQPILTTYSSIRRRNTTMPSKHENVGVRTVP